LPMPEDGELLANTLLVKAARNTSVLPRGGPWKAADREAVGNGTEPAVELTAAKRTNRADLELRWEGGDTAASTIVDRAWIQSWLTSAARQDRAVYQFTSSRSALEVGLPDGAAADTILLDGRVVESRAVGEGRVVVPLAGGGNRHRFVLELRYHFPEARPPRGDMDLEFPRLGADVWVRRLYWQLILPANEHLIGDPDGFMGECVWGWRGYFWGRQPLLDQSQLESWSGAANGAALPERANLYLFSSLGKVGQAEVRTAGRTWLVLWASGVALVAGLLLIYVPACRHPASLLAAGIVLAAVGLAAPEPTLLLAQAAVLGLALTLLAGLLERSVGRRRGRVLRKEPLSALVEVSSTHTAHYPGVAGQAPTESLPAMLPEPSGKSQR
jgi:hypothetical protein